METPEDNPSSSPLAAQWAGLRQRVISAAVMAVLTLSLLIIGGTFFSALVLVAALLMLREWDELTRDFGGKWALGGLFYVAVPCVSLLWLRNLRWLNFPDGGLYAVLFVMLVVCATDIGAYFFGKYFGGPKMIPAVSPSKTWSGMGGGALCAGGIGIIASGFAPYPAAWQGGFALGIILAVVAQAGDVFESWTKRRAGVKDSGALIPGHGGLLDRVDGLMAAVPVYALLIYCFGQA